jgi:hypothetical protein
MIRRREFITLLGGGAAWPIAARGRVRTFPRSPLLNPSAAIEMSLSLYTPATRSTVGYAPKTGVSAVTGP